MEIEDMRGEGNCLYKITDIEGDMGQKTCLNLLLQEDQDVILAIQDMENGRRLSIEFCSISAGGGRNPIIVNGLREIIKQLVAAEKGK